MSKHYRFYAGKRQLKTRAFCTLATAQQLARELSAGLGRTVEAREVA